MLYFCRVETVHLDPPRKKSILYYLFVTDMERLYNIKKIRHTALGVGGSSSSEVKCVDELFFGNSFKL